MSSLGDPANPIHPSQSVSSTACQSPALPWEVIERTIDHCFGDRASLRAFSLTCSQLRPRSLFVLFINVDIQSAKQLKAFYDAVQAQPHLQPVVKSLSFPWDEASPSLLLSILPGLRQITFNKISFVITDHDRLSQSPLPSGDQRVTSLRSLFIQNASFPLQSTFLHFLSAFPNVENVTCERLSLHQDPLPEGVPGGLTLNARKTISWSDEFSMCFRPLSEKWALNEDNRYCEFHSATIILSWTLT
ncbi:hypothetical protein BD310DRAFT_829240 [Dichomitus squalens]|uniref:Uncharacterized protein n=1 Tax=Dichomitus squalens TaxID=114155 RepID=A0A4Q9PID5_9APHY|nr:hypothetical protein BD310DRAFT_829240 [Dichomitus squalens]